MQKAWMVCTFSTPGVSSARANSRRATTRRRASLGAPEPSRIALSRAVSSSVVHAASVSNTRFAILAAAALVKVMQRIFSGSTPLSRRLMTRCASTWVLPDPAPHLAIHAPRQGWCPVVSFAAAVIVGSAACRPFLDAGEMVVIAVVIGPHRMNQRTVRLPRVVETSGEAAQFFKRPIGLAVRRTVLERNRLIFAGRFAAFE